MENKTSKTEETKNNKCACMQKYRGCICKNKYEYTWFKDEVFCFFCGIRCGLMTLGIVSSIEGILLTILGIYFAIGNVRSWFGAVIDISSGITLTMFGPITIYAVYYVSEQWMKICYYLGCIVLLVLICVNLFGITEFIIIESYGWLLYFIYNLISTIIIIGYIVWKIKRFHNLIFVHYQELNDGNDINDIELKADDNKPTNDTAITV